MVNTVQPSGATSLSYLDRVQPFLLLASIAFALGVAHVAPASAHGLAPLVTTGVFLVIYCIMFGVSGRDVMRAFVRRKLTVLTVGINFIAFFSRLLFLFIICGCLLVPATCAEAGELRFGVTQAMYVKDSLLYDRWAGYLSEHLGLTVRFVFRRSYHDMQEMLQRGDLDLAWVCGYPYVQGEADGYLRYIATPLFQGEANYRIYLIVPATSKAASIEDLKGSIFAFSDPDSVSFRVVAAGLLTNGQPITDFDSFFRIHLFTFGHAETIRAVADGVADGGTVDSQVWDALSGVSPELTRRTKIVARIGDFGLPPIVASARMKRSQRDRIASALKEMSRDSLGQAILGDLLVDRFNTFNDDLYQSIRLLGLDSGQHSRAGAAP